MLGAFGDPRNGLNTETVREASEMLSTPSVGDRPGAVIVGPVDILTHGGAIDSLLKVIEEAHPRLPRPFLWAWDGGAVRATIRSRCLLEWCPGQVFLDKKLVEAARLVVDSALSGSTAGVLESLADVKKLGQETKKEWSATADDFLVAVAHVLASRSGHAHLKLWAKVRPLMESYTTPTYGEVVVGFLP